MKTHLTILYEDCRGQLLNFGLHKLVMACVFDRLNGEAHLLYGAVRDYQAKGDANLLRKCCHDVEEIAPDGHPVVAVFDNDRIRRLLGLPTTTSDADVKAAIKSRKTSAGSMEVALLKENTESLLRSAQHCGVDISADLVERAVERKELNARDVIFGRVANPEKRALRDCVLEKNDSLGELVRCLSSLLMPRLFPSAAP